MQRAGNHRRLRRAQARGGYVLILTMLLMILLAVIALSWNRRSFMRLRMSSASLASSQRYFDQVGLIDKAVWKLTQDPCWRTGSTGLVEVLNGDSYVITASNSAVAGYGDAVTISCSLSGTSTRLRGAFRYFIEAFAGNGTPGYTGDGAAASLARLNSPAGLAMDAAGNLYIADRDNHCIRKVSASGTISTIAGTGQSGYTGNGGPATSARLNSPRGVTVDGAGDIFIADTGNHWVRKVDSAGIITLYRGASVLGAPSPGSAGQALNSPFGVFGASNPFRVYIADTDNHRVISVDRNGIATAIAGTGSSGYSGDGGSATSAQLDTPRGVFLAPSGDVYIADTLNHRIRKVSSSGIITTVAGNGSPGYSGDGGPATAARLNQPRAVFVDAADNLFLVDSQTSSLRVVSHLDRVIRTLAGTGNAGYDADGVPAAFAQLNAPVGVTMNATRGGRCIYVSDRDDHRVRALRWRAERILY